MATSPAHYYPLTEAYGSNPLTTTVTDLGSLASSSTAQYIGLTANSNAGFNLSTTANDATGYNTTAFIGGNVGPTVLNNPYVTDLGNNATAVANQLPGFYPNYGYSGSASNTATGVNRVFEPNMKAALDLGSNATFTGNTTSGAFTFAGWVSLAQGKAQTDDSGTWDNGATIFDAGNSGNNVRDMQVVDAGYGGIQIQYGTSQNCLSQTAWYPSGTPQPSNGADRGPAYGNWEFVLVSTSGTSDAQRYANTQVWINGYLATTSFNQNAGGSAYPLAPTNGDGATGGLGIAKVGYLAASTAGGLTPSPGNASNVNGTELIGNKIGDVATWNSALSYDAMESLYVAAVTPLSGGSANSGTPVPPTDITTADGGWGNSSLWTAQTVANGVTSGTANIYPLQHGQNMPLYYDVQINNNITAGGTGQGGYGITSTYSFRSDMYRLTVSAASSASLTLQPGTTLRTYENMNLLGTINMNGDGGTMAPDNWTASSKLDCGQNATIGSAAVITMNAAPAGGTAGVQAAPAGDTPIGANAIVAEGNLTIQPGAALVVNASNYLQTQSLGPQLFTVAQANSALGDGASGLGRSGSLSGTFNVTLNQPSTLRQLFVLYENGGTSGVGTVDSVKIGFAVPGDANLDGSIDINDVFQIAPHFNTGPEYSGTSHVTTNNWRTGDFIGDGNVDVRDINLLRENYGLNYSTSPAISPVKPAVLAIGGPTVLQYNPVNGDVVVVAPGPIDGLTLESAGDQLNPSGWTGPNGASDFVTLRDDLIGFNGFLSGDSVSAGSNLGDILPAGLNQSQLNSDLTFQYFNQGSNTPQNSGFVAVPEPSSIALLLAGAGMAVACALRRRCLSRSA